MRLTSSLILLAGALALTLYMGWRRQQRAKHDDSIILYDMDGPRRIPRPAEPSAAEVAANLEARARAAAAKRAASADKTCRANLGIVQGWPEFHEPTCPIVGTCHASVERDRVRFECGRCVLEVDLVITHRTTFIDQPLFLDGMSVDLQLEEQAGHHWLAVRDARGKDQLLLAIAQGQSVPPNRPDFFAPLQIEPVSRAQRFRYAGKVTELPARTDCISADHGFYYFAPGSRGFIAYASLAAAR